MKIDLIVGTRPNFVKIASLVHSLHFTNSPIKYRIIHTGQHYDDQLSQSFFDQLEISKPDINLKVGSGSQAEQTAAIMVAYEKILKEKKPDFCLVVGDVTSSMACAVTAKKSLVKVIHVEAGIRSMDWEMPEEVNRVLIDSIADSLFTTTPEATQFLLENGKTKNQVFFVGNTMIDTLLKFQSKFRQPEIWNHLALKKSNYFILTLHRPSNVDELKSLKLLISEILKNAQGLPVIFPIHPRTAKILKEVKFSFSDLYIIEPLSYLEFNYMVANSKAIITDSGGITEEATVLGIPCFTLRNTTERPETITIGTNELIGTNPKNIKPAMEKLFDGNWKKGSIPAKWDGKTGDRIIKILEGL